MFCSNCGTQGQEGTPGSSGQSNRNRPILWKAANRGGANKDAARPGVGVVDLIIPTGFLSQERVLHSLELFGKEVLPRIHALSGAGK
jgi:hypothetical protein